MKNSDRYYCFPDIHGCYDVLKKALNFVYAENPNGGKIIFLGDYIDRGPNNAGVLDTVMNPPEGWEFVCLLGNHEEMFMDSYREKTSFYDVKAANELSGYGPDAYIPYSELHRYMKTEYIDWMKTLKVFHIEDKNVFAHAYYDDSYPPENQSRQVCIWDRMSDSEQYWNEKQGLFLTHGHTPRKHGPVFAPNRVNLDAGAVFYGRFVIAEYKKGIQGPVGFHEFEV